MIDTVDLARRPDVAIGETRVRPSLRIVIGPAGTATVEPRVLQVLLALYDADGAVLSRDQLLATCWSGLVVGDDAINRTIAEIRRVIKQTGAGFEIETIPRVGYRFVDLSPAQETSGSGANSGFRIDRRHLVMSGVAGLAVLGAGSAALIYSRRDREIDALIERGRIAQASGLSDADQRAERLFREAIDKDPARADGWGWLARTVAEPEQARELALHALELDGKEPNARAVLAVQSRDLISWFEWENSLLEILEENPDNTLCLDYLSVFLQGMGRCSASWDVNERASSLEPFNPLNHQKRALKNWIFGHNGTADRIADQAIEIWPRNAYVWNARLITYAFTDRAPAALAMIEDKGNRPVNLTEPSVSSWLAALRAIASRSAQDIAGAIETCTETAMLAPGLAANAIMVFSYLGETDAAYRVAEGLFDRRGPIVQQFRGRGIRDMYSEKAWGNSQFVFTPAASNFRSDPRFTSLCERTGHMDYWEQRGVWPDEFVRGSLVIPA